MKERGRKDERSDPDSSSPLRSPPPSRGVASRVEGRRTRRKGEEGPNQGKRGTKAQLPELDVTAFRLTMRAATMHDFAPLFAPIRGTSARA